MNNKLALILPCYNEEEILPISYIKISSYWKKLIKESSISDDSKIIFVDDGSNDQTWSKINEISSYDDSVIGIKLSRNFGHQNALLAGLTEVKNQFDCYITLDIDLQDEISAISEMLAKYKLGCAIVYGVRSDRENDSFFKRSTAHFFYSLMNKMGVPTIYNHADYRLINNQALNEFFHYSEVNLFLRGIFPEIGFKTDIIYYKRLKRDLGESKYPLKKMIRFAWQGITSFSTFPLRLILQIGILISILSLVLTIWILTTYFQGNTVPGWTSMLLPIAFFGGVQMISIGIIGDYIGKIYMEVKRRPRFIVEKTINKPV